MIQIKRLPLKSTKHINLVYVDDFNQLIDDINRLYDSLPEVTIKQINTANIENAFYSCVIEGAVSTIADSINLLTSNKPAITHSEQMIKNYRKLYNSDVAKDLFTNIYTIADVWNILSYKVLDSDDNHRPFRATPVKVMNPYTEQIFHEGLESSLIEEYLVNLYSFLNEENGVHPLVKACILHFYFEHIHPFCDCNGRTGRYLFSAYLVNQTPYKKFIAAGLNTLICKQKFEYSSSLHINTSHPDITHSIKFMLNILKTALFTLNYITIDNDIGRFLREQVSEYVYINDIQLLSKLYDAGLVNSDRNNLYAKLTPDTAKAIQLYHKPTLTSYF